MTSANRPSRAERRMTRHLAQIEATPAGLARLAEVCRWIRAEAGRMDVAGQEAVVVSLVEYATGLNGRAGDRR